ncbi:hypothetical protein MRGA423_17070 [Mycobacterium tuberculosis RGTB423]|nr:hypothetical protein MRGA423_17070 [Mycobacterium tuberculosis RGTB423]
MTTADPMNGPQQGVDPRAERPGGVEPRARGDYHGKAEQHQRDSVAAMPGLDVAGSPDRPRRAAGALGRHHPDGTHGPAAGESGRHQQRPMVPSGGSADPFDGPRPLSGHGRSRTSGRAPRSGL